MSRSDIAASARAARKKSTKKTPSRQQKRITRQLEEGRGPIERGKDYPIALFKQLTGLMDYAIRQRQQQGLKVRVIGNERRIIGDDWLDFMESQEPEKVGS